MKKIAISLLILLFSCVDAAWSDESKSETDSVKTKLKSGLEIEAYTTRTVDDAKGSINRLKNAFDGIANTYWLFSYSEQYKYAYEMDEADVSLVIKLPEPVYIKKIKINNGCKVANTARPTPGVATKIYVERRYMPEGTYPFGKMIELTDTIDEQIFSLENSSSWQELFRADRVVVHVYDIKSQKKSSNSDICISDIDFEYANQLTYKPTTSWSSLKNLILSGISYRNGKKWDAEEVLGDKNYLLDFLFYIVTGNEEASTLFDNYSPVSTSDSETVTFVFKPAIKEALNRRAAR